MGKKLRAGKTIRLRKARKRSDRKEKDVKIVARKNNQQKC
jgi:hypothetical protein